MYFVVVVLRQGFIMEESWLSWNSLCRPGVFVFQDMVSLALESVLALMVEQAGLEHT